MATPETPKTPTVPDCIRDLDSELQKALLQQRSMMATLRPENNRRDANNAPRSESLGRGEL